MISTVKIEASWIDMICYLENILRELQLFENKTGGTTDIQSLTPFVSGTLV